MVAQAQDTYTPAIPAPGGTPRALTPQERGRLGGQATFARYGRDHYAAIGRVGFARAIEAGWGEYLLEKLAPSYRAKFGRDPVLGRNKAGDKARAEARKATPTLGVVRLAGLRGPGDRAAPRRRLAGQRRYLRPLRRAPRRARAVLSGCAPAPPPVCPHAGAAHQARHCH